MTRDSERLAAYMATPFWDLHREPWLTYVNGLRGEDRHVLSHYPFRWAYAPPHDPASGIEFLRDCQLEFADVEPSAIENLRAKLPTFSGLLQQGCIEWIEEHIEGTPRRSFRQIPEWEPMAGLLIHWPALYPPLWSLYRQMIAAIDHSTAFLRIPEGYFGATVLAWLEARGIDLDKVRPIPSPISDIWAKDYSPFYGISTESGEGVAHKFRYSAHGEYPRDREYETVEIDEKLSWVEGFASYHSGIRLDGGMIQTTDGDGTYVLTRRVLADNPSVPDLEPRLRAWFGADELVLIDEQPGDILGHINHFRFVAPGKVMLGAADDSDTPVHSYLGALRAQFEGRGYEVFDLPYTERFEFTTPLGGRCNPVLYANCVLLNERVLVPIFDMEGAKAYNERAVEAYRRALPDREVVPLDVTVLARNGGGMYCGSKEIPDLSRLDVG